MEIPEGLEEGDDAPQLDENGELIEQYEDDEEDGEMLEIDENQLHALIIQYQQQMAGQPTEPIYNEDGEPIQLNQ